MIIKYLKIGGPDPLKVHFLHIWHMRAIPDKSLIKAVFFRFFDKKQQKNR